MLCCVCGFRSRHGVIYGHTAPVSMRMFACETCFAKPYLFFPCKFYIRPTWLIEIPLDKWTQEAEG
ncbi:unnamed protein product [marine sediment metagenome]|uniref:Uncharacterized protein n=1 Tax=marine sediment metagenome TaxID=412755 RepID=X1HWP5_9ZZZZ